MAQVLQSSGTNAETDIGLVRQQAVQVAESAERITVTANEVAEGAEVQLRVLERTVAIANEITASMGETTSQLDSIATSTDPDFSHYRLHVRLGGLQLELPLSLVSLEPYAIKPL